MDLVTVTATKDKEVFCLHAHSINKFVNDPTTHWVIIEDNATPEEEWIKLLTPIYSKHKFNLIYNPYPEFDNIGWVRQQILKFTIAELVGSDHYIILDTKNICIKTVSFDQMPEGNKTIILENNIRESRWYEWIQHIHNVTGKECPTNFWSPETPFKVRTNTVNEIISSVNIFEIFSISQIHKSEFILYKFFTNSIPTGPDGKNEEGMINWTFWDTIPTVSTIVNTLANRPDVLIIGLHNTALSNSKENIPDLINWLKKTGLETSYIEVLNKWV